MNRSIGDVFEDYIDDLVNLPSEVHDKMQELRLMDEEFQRHRDAFGKQKRAHLILLQNDNKLALSSTLTGSPTTPSPTTRPPSLSTVASLELVEKEYKAAIDLQDQKIDTARQMYDRVSLHIEQLDFEMVQNNISVIPAGHRKQRTNHYQSFPMDHYDISSSSPSTSIYHRQRSSNASSATHNLDHASSPRPRYSTGGLPQKHYLDVGGSRKWPGSTGARKRAHDLPRSNPPFDLQVLAEQEINPNEPRYCHCNQVSYGDMVACDGDNCEKEWFHYACVGLVEPPVGKWFCSECMTN